MESFDAFNPKKKHTDPNNLGAQTQYPAHMFKWHDGPRESHEPVNDYLTVQNEDERETARRAGWSDTPVASAPVAEVAADDEEPIAVKRGPGRPPKVAA